MWTLSIAARSEAEGSGKYTSLSNRPGLRNAGSIASGLHMRHQNFHTGLQISCNVALAELESADLNKVMVPFALEAIPSTS